MIFCVRMLAISELLNIVKTMSSFHISMHHIIRMCVCEGTKVGRVDGEGSREGVMGHIQNGTKRVTLFGCWT